MFQWTTAFWTYVFSRLQSVISTGVVVVTRLTSPTSRDTVTSTESAQKSVIVQMLADNPCTMVRLFYYTHCMHAGIHPFKFRQYISTGLNKVNDAKSTTVTNTLSLTSTRWYGRHLSKERSKTREAVTTGSGRPIRCAHSPGHVVVIATLVVEPQQ